MPDASLIPIRRALISVSDKDDLIPFAKSLAELGVEIISTGGTAAALSQAGVKVIPIDQVTGFPEMMDGRVKTLHPAIHGALLGRRDLPAHVQAMKQHNILPIDLVCVNLYPFERTILTPGIRDEQAIEQIDIGGPSMQRSNCFAIAGPMSACWRRAASITRTPGARSERSITNQFPAECSCRTAT